jgi:large subunit ribosomal protein L3
MINGLLGKKIGMTQIFSEDGDVIPVTIIEAGTCKVIRVKSEEKDGYNAVQLGFGEIAERKVKKPRKGIFDKAGAKPTRYLKEVRVESVDDIQVGQEVFVDIFAPGEHVDIAGISKGRGFAGVMKRHNFSGAPASHGTHEAFRHGGSIGTGAAWPSRVMKGKKMAGQMGNERVTIQNIEVVRVVKDQNLLLIRGAVPGSKDGLLIIKKSLKKKGKPEVKQDKKES